MRTIAIVVTYNRKELLMQSIQALLKQSYRNFDILVVDNGSSDGTKEAIQHWIDSGTVFYLNTGQNIGGAGGFNVGIRWAAEAGYDVLWIMDDDCLPTETALEALVCADRALQGQYGFLSSVALWKDGQPCQMNIQSVSPWKKVNLDDAFVQSNDYQKANYATFVSLFFRREAVMTHGLPIKEFFIWADDMEYTRRISRHHPCYVVHGSVVIHACERNQAGNIAKDSPDRFFRYQCSYRNEVYVYRREGLSGACYVALRVLWHLFKVLSGAPDQRGKRSALVLSSVFAGLRFKPPVEYIQAAQNAQGIPVCNVSERP